MKSTEKKTFSWKQYSVFISFKIDLIKLIIIISALDIDLKCPCVARIVLLNGF